MFVRIRKQDGQVLYHCDKIHVLDDPEREHVFQVTVETPEKTRRRAVDKTTDEMYVMNDDGATIDTYRWPELRDG